MGLMYSILQCQQNNVAVSSALCSGCYWAAVGCSARSSPPPLSRAAAEKQQKAGIHARLYGDLHFT